MKIELKNKQFIIDGKSTIIMAGEIHYYRLHKCDWQNRIDLLKEAGFNAVATYIPWCVHEQKEGDIDVTGIYKDQYDLIGFLKLCVENDLYVIARPGPFVMAEMINDGIPTWVSKKFPEVLPVTWDNNKATTVTHDYTNPDFLAASKTWIDVIIDVLKQTCMDKLISIQIDNEIGMLSWVSNCPDLTEVVIKDFTNYLNENNLASTYDFDINDMSVAIDKFRSPEESYIIEMHEQYGDYSRIRFKNYIHTITSWYEEAGITNVPFAINIHGTGAGKLYGYPIGLSQLYKAFDNDDRFYTGSDIYFHEIDIAQLPDTTMTNLMTECLNTTNQPLSSLEYSSSNGDYGFDFGARISASNFSLRTRLMLGQNNKLFNFYLFTGGFNDYLNEPIGDGVDRIATTGEYHGYGVPVTPTGEKNYFYNKVKEVGTLFTNLSDQLGDAFQEKDNLAIAFIPDYFKTEYCYNNDKVRQKIANIERFRSNAMLETLVRYLNMRSIQPNCINIQDNEIETEVLAIASASYMSSEIQTKLVKFIENGGKLYIQGTPPIYDMLGNSCTILIDFLGLSINENPTVLKPRIAGVPSGPCEGLVQTFMYDIIPVTVTKKHEPLMLTHGTSEMTSVYINDNMKVVGIFNHFRCDLQFYDKIMELLEVKPVLNIDQPNHGIVATSMAGSKANFINVLNMDDVSYEFGIEYNGQQLFSNLSIGSLEGILIPINVELTNAKVNIATCDIYEYNEKEITFRLPSGKTYIELEYNGEIEVNSYGVEITKENNKYIINKQDRLFSEEFIKVGLK